MSEIEVAQAKILSPIVGAIGQNKIINWRGFKILTGPGKSTAILDEIQHRRKKVMQNANVIVGNPGDGKSYFALRLAEILDPDFNPYVQVVFERSHLLWVIGPDSPLKMGQVILIDEAQFVAGARRWYEDVQKDIMEHIEAIRSKGYVIIIVVLHLELLDKIMRKFVLNCMMSMLERGKAKVYHLWIPTFQDKQFHKSQGKMALQLPAFEQCAYPNCLICKFLFGVQKCQTIRAIYERRKREFLDKMSRQSQEKAAARDRKQRVINYNDTIEKIAQFKEKLVFARNRVEPESVKLILEEDLGLQLTDGEVSKVIRRGAIKHPEIFKPQPQLQQTKIPK